MKTYIEWYDKNFDEHNKQLMDKPDEALNHSEQALKGAMLKQCETKKSQLAKEERKDQQAAIQKEAMRESRTQSEKNKLIEQSINPRWASVLEKTNGS